MSVPREVSRNGVVKIEDVQVKVPLISRKRLRHAASFEV